MTTKTKPAAFTWDEKTTNRAIEMYKTLLADEGKDVANTNDSLLVIAKEIGAKSAQAVRSKLSSAKVYEKAAQARSVGGKVKTAKVHYIRAIRKAAENLGIEVTGRKFESLEQGVGTDLQLLVAVIEKATGEKLVINPDAPTSEAKAPKQVTAKA